MNRSRLWLMIVLAFAGGLIVGRTLRRPVPPPTHSTEDILIARPTESGRVTQAFIVCRIVQPGGRAVEPEPIPRNANGDLIIDGHWHLSVAGTSYYIRERR